MTLCRFQGGRACPLHPASVFAKLGFLCGASGVVYAVQQKSVVWNDDVRWDQLHRGGFWSRNV